MTFLITQTSPTEPEYAQFRSIATQWSNQTEGACRFLRENPQDYQQMFQSENICWGLSLPITKEDSDPVTQCFISYKPAGVPQALMMTTEKNNTIHILYLATNPLNILSSTGDHKALIQKRGELNHPTKGSGTSLMNHIIQEALKKGSGLKLDADQSTKTFYERFGFIGPEAKDSIPMHLSLEKIRSLYQQSSPSLAAYTIYQKQLSA